MKFYVEASLFVSALPDDSDALMGYASDERYRDPFIMPLLHPTKKGKTKKSRYAQDPDAAFSVMDKKWSKTLELRVGAGTDEARVFLSQQGCKYKSDATVMRKIRKICGENGEEFLANWKRPDRNDKTVIRKIEALQAQLAANESLLAEPIQEFACRMGISAKEAKHLRADIQQCQQNVRQLLADSKLAEDGELVYYIPLFVLDSLAREAKERDKERKRKHARKKAREKLR